MPIESIKDDDKIYAGTCIRFYNTEKSIAEQCVLPCREDNRLDYIISCVYGNS